MRSALHYPASTSTSSADFGEHHRPMRLDGANLDCNGTVRCNAVFFLDQTARLICTSPFRMNSGASGGRIWDSTHLLSSSMSSPCLLSFMLSVGRLNAAMLCEVIVDSPTQIKLIVGARLRLRAPGCRPRSRRPGR